MAAFASPERFARFSTRRPWTVVAIWAALLVLSFFAVSRIGDVLTTSGGNYVSTESERGDNLLEDRFWGGELPGTEVVVVQSADRTVDAPAFAALLTDLTARLQALPEDVRSVGGFALSGDRSLVSPDGRTTILPVTLAGAKDDAEDHIKPLVNVLDRFDGRDGFTVVTGGDGSSNLAFTETSKSDLETAEVFGIPVALLILVLVFGALVAAGLPILLGLGAIIVALGATAVIGQAFELLTFVINFVTTMGLAVGIDYTLVIVQRVREERARGLDRDSAIIRAGATASRSVLFSGLAVIVALFGMVLVPNSIFRSLGIGAILVVAAAVLAALTLLPAVLRLLGDRMNAVRIRIPWRRQTTRSGSAAFWERSTRFVTRHPVASVVASVTLLAAAAVPYATIKLGWAGVSSLPSDTESHRAFSILNEEFSAGEISPVRIAVDTPDADGPQTAGAVSALLASLGQDHRFGAPSVQRNPSDPTILLITVPTTADPQGDIARDAVIDLRDRYVPAAFGENADNVYVTGNTAQGIDNTSIISDYTIPVFAFVLSLSFVILLVVFRSIVVPLKAMVMNLLSVGAAYGLMVLVFQHGIGSGLFGFQQVERIETWVPLFMFAVLFGLSMDYHVFLLSRIREHYNHTGDNTESIIHGVRSTAGMITGAAAIMIAVFAGFASGQMTMFQQMGFGLAVAVFLDATIVRIVLVPASMQLLGTRNWYLPRWLSWLPRVEVEGSLEPERTPAPHALPQGADALPGR